MTDDTSAGHDTATDDEEAPSVRRRAGWALAAVLAVAVYAVGIGVAGARDAWDALTSAEGWPLLGAFLLQVGVTATWPMVHRASAMAVGHRLNYGQSLNISMTAFSLSHLLPGGGAVAAAAVVQRLGRYGVPGPAAAASVTLTGAVSVTTISLLGAAGIAGAVVAGDLGGTALLAAAVAVTVLLALIASITVVLRSPEKGNRLLDAVGRLHHRIRARVDEWRGSLQGVTEDPPTMLELLQVVAWSAIKWAADITSLALVFAAIDEPARITALLVGFGVAQLGAAIPITPGGVGFVESGMVGAFVALGTPLSAAVGVVLTYRVLETWLPALAGLIALVNPPAAGAGADASSA